MRILIINSSKYQPAKNQKGKSVKKKKTPLASSFSTARGVEIHKTALLFNAKQSEFIVFHSKINVTVSDFQLLAAFSIGYPFYVLRQINPFFSCK